jgi:hypothetical protein
LQKSHVQQIESKPIQQTKSWYKFLSKLIQEKKSNSKKMRVKSILQNKKLIQKIESETYSQKKSDIKIRVN